MKMRKRWGDRRDGTRIRKTDAMHSITPLIFPDRVENQVYFRVSVDIEPAEKYLRKWNREHPEDKISLFQLIITAVMKSIRLRQQMNRFIVNQTLYQRNELTAAFTVKKVFSDDGDETLTRISVSDEDTLSTIAGQIRQQIHLCKTGTDQSSDAMGFIQKLPGQRLFGAAARTLDRHGWMPSSVIASDPFQCSVVFANIGSVGMDSFYHNLKNWGTTSIIIVVGTKQKKARYDEKGNVFMRKELELSCTLDERISDGYYYGTFLRLFKKLVGHPELLELPMAQEVK